MLWSRILVSRARKARENLLQCHVLGAKKETSASRVRSAGLLLAEHFFVARKNATPRFNSEVRSASGVITWTGLPDSRPKPNVQLLGRTCNKSTLLRNRHSLVSPSLNYRKVHPGTQRFASTFKHLGLAFRFGDGFGCLSHSKPEGSGAARRRHP